MICSMNMILFLAYCNTIFLSLMEVIKLHLRDCRFFFLLDAD